MSIFANSIDFGEEKFNSVEKDEDEEVADYVIRIYEVKGNRKRKLSVTQNKQLRDMVFK